MARVGRKQLFTSIRFLISQCSVRHASLDIGRWMGKTAVVTGAGGAIGSCTCAKLVQEGLTVVAVDLKKNKLLDNLQYKLKDACGKLCVETCDITNEKQVEELFCKIEEKYNSTDICLCCAGTALPGSIMDGMYKDWKTQMDVNLMGLALCTRAALQSMKRKCVKEGHIIHIGSISGHRVSEKEDLHFYQVTKHAVSTLGEALRFELAVKGCPYKLTQVCPGYVDTGLWDKMYRGRENSGQKVKDIKPPSQKLLEADDVANIIVFAIATPPHVVINDILLRTMGTTL